LSDRAEERYAVDVATAYSDGNI